MIKFWRSIERSRKDWENTEGDQAQGTGQNMEKINKKESKF